MTVLHRKIPIFNFHLLSMMNFLCIRVYQNRKKKIKRVIFPKFRASKIFFFFKLAYQPIFTFIRFLRFHLRITSSVPWKKLGAYDCPLGWRGKYYRSCLRNFHEPMKFCQICCQLTNFHFYQLSKVFMTVHHQNMTNDNAPPKYDKWPCSTEI